MGLNVLSWDDYFMSVAFLSARRSVDPERRGGACIVNTENRIVGIGYCGFPRGIDVEPSNHDRQFFLCHSVMNAILNKNQYDVRGSRIYTTRYPCSECAKMIIQAGVDSIIFDFGDPNEASRILFHLAGVSVIKYSTMDLRTVVLHPQPTK